MWELGLWHWRRWQPDATQEMAGQGGSRWSGGISEGVEGDSGLEGARGGGQVGSTLSWWHVGVVGVWW
jgi:hypothetical protein